MTQVVLLDLYARILPDTTSVSFVEVLILLGESFEQLYWIMLKQITFNTKNSIILVQIAMVKELTIEITVFVRG